MKKRILSKYSFLLGLTGILGFAGINGNPVSFLCFSFFGCLSNIWWFKLGMIDDERLASNRNKAGSISFRLCFSIAFLLSIIVGMLCLNFELLYKIQLIIFSLAFATSINLWAFLTYIFHIKG